MIYYDKLITVLKCVKTTSERSNQTKTNYVPLDYPINVKFKIMSGADTIREMKDSNTQKAKLYYYKGEDIQEDDKIEYQGKEYKIVLLDEYDDDVQMYAVLEKIT